MSERNVGEWRMIIQIPSTHEHETEANARKQLGSMKLTN